MLNQEAITRGVNCLALFAERLQGFPMENVNVVGTYTLRRAINNDEFLRQAAKVFPIPLILLVGKRKRKPSTLAYAILSQKKAESLL